MSGFSLSVSEYSCGDYSCSLVGMWNVHDYICAWIYVDTHFSETLNMPLIAEHVSSLY